MQHAETVWSRNIKTTHTASVFSTYISFITSRASSHTRQERKILPNFFIISTKIHSWIFFSWKKKEFVLAQMYLSKVQLVQIDPHYTFFEQFASSLGSCMAPKVSVKLYD